MCFCGFCENYTLDSASPKTQGSKGAITPNPGVVNSFLAHCSVVQSSDGWMGVWSVWQCTADNVSHSGMEYRLRACFLVEKVT